MVYNWDGKEAECYRLYVEEKKSLDEVMEYWDARGFSPSKRAFQTQFKRWDFPSKQNPAYQNPALVARVKALWETNTAQKDMLGILQSEGFQINDRELVRLRLRFKWMLRSSRRKRSRGNETNAEPTPSKTKKRKVMPGRGIINQIANSMMQEESAAEEDESEDEQEVHEEPLKETTADVSLEPAPLDPAEALRRQMRQEQLRVESAEKWRTRKRRRRTREWAGLPADAPGAPPRFPSETTLDESKAYLNLDNALYRQVRDQFQEICEEEGVLKKTTAGPEKWSQLKHRLVRENAHLSSTFQQDPEAIQHIGTMPGQCNPKALSLDVICMDVTKRLRTLGSRMGVIEAKNALGLNPEDSRQARTAFQELLKADHFTNKYEAGDQRWNELKQTWIQRSERLTRILAAGNADPKHSEKIKAIEVLGRDVMKRLRAEICQKDSPQKKQANTGPGPGPAPPTLTPHASNAHRKDTQRATTTANTNGSNNNASQSAANFASMPASSDFQIDPSLLLAASDPSMIAHPAQNTVSAQRQRRHAQPAFPPQFSNPQPLPIYFRLHPLSQTSWPNKTVWLCILETGTVAEIRSLAVREHPGTVVVKLEGLVVYKLHGHPDREVMVTIDDEDELAAYLQHVGTGKATFVVLLAFAQGGAYV